MQLPSRRGARGLYLRDAAELTGPLSYGVSVKPLFIDHAGGAAWGPKWPSPHSS